MPTWTHSYLSANGETAYCTQTIIRKPTLVNNGSTCNVDVSEFALGKILNYCLQLENLWPNKFCFSGISSFTNFNFIYFHNLQVEQHKMYKTAYT